MTATLDGRYAQVVVDVPARRVDKCYDYIIPDNLMDKIVPGSRVLVPFGPRSVEGFVVARTEKPAVAKVKPITACVKSAPPVPEDLLAVARWMADEYMCLLIEALRALVPSGTKLESSTIVRVCATDEDAEGAKISGAAKEVFDYLVECGGSARRDEIASSLEIADITRPISALTKAGLVETDTMWAPPRVRPRTVRAFRLASEEIDPQALALSLAPGSPARAAVMRVFAEDIDKTGTKGLAIPRAELLERAGCSSSVVDALVRDGMLERMDVAIQRDPTAGLQIEKSVPPVLTDDQEHAVNRITDVAENGGGVVLLHGVTGSGKTEVYLRAIQHVIDRGKQGILLVPDISLTPQMVDVVMGRFGDRVALLHSALGAGERLDEWERARAGDADVVVGARSAVFAPVPSLGMIIVDEEHDSSYKQDDSPRYNARDVAIFRAKQVGATVVLGSATPALETYELSELGECERIELPSRIDHRPLPEIRVVDMRREMKSGNKSVFSNLLRSSVEEVLDSGQQVMLFLNRRGFSTFAMCLECGQAISCPNCDVSLTYHARASEMVCHYCNWSQPVPDVCPVCGGMNMKYSGTGTERIEEAVRKEFPRARVARMDVDTTRRKGAHRAILGAFRAGRTDILIGTQMIAKGLDFPNVTLVGVISADTSLNLPDFRAAERTFQLISQVAGRSGRGSEPGLVVVQTFNPEHYSIMAAAAHDYRAFYDAEIAARREMGYPPARRMARILVRGEDESATAKAAGKIRRACTGTEPVARGAVEVIGPAPAPIQRIAGKYRWHLLLFSSDADAIRAVAAAGCQPRLAGVTISVDMDPSSIL